MKYTVPSEIKLVDGKFFYGETVRLEVDGNRMIRKVQYSSLNGLYVTINGTKYGKNDIQDWTSYAHYAVMYQDLSRKDRVQVEATYFYARNEVDARCLLSQELQKNGRAYCQIKVLSIVKIDD